MAATYRIEVQDSDGVRLGEFTNFKSLRFSKRLNDYGSCEFMIPANDPRASSLVALRRYTVHVWRDEEGYPSELKWAGEQVVRRGQLRDNLENWVTMYAYTFLERLNGRYTDEELRIEDTDAGFIATILINGAFGTGSIPNPTVNRTREYHNDNVYESIKNLSNVIGGFDFEVDDLNTFRASAVIGVDRTDSVILEYGQNVSSVDIEEDFSIPVNRAIVLGQVDGGSDLVRVEVDDVDSQAVYDIRERVITEPDISELATFEDKGQALIDKYKEPLMRLNLEILPNLRPTIREFNIGDILRVIVKWGIYDLDSPYRVFEWQVDVRDDSTEQVSLVLGEYTIEE